MLAKLGLRERALMAKDRLVPAIRRLGSGSAMARWADMLLERAVGALGALDRRSTVRGESAMRGISVDEWKEHANRLRLGTYADLMAIAAANNLPRAWPDNFFRTASSEKDAETLPGASTTTPPSV